MKTLDKKARREIAFLLGLFLVFAVALALWTWAKSDSSPFKNMRGSDSPWRIGTSRWHQATIALSPDGLYLAALCPTPPRNNATGFPRDRPQNNNGQSSGPQSSDLVIWRVSDRSELARKSVGFDTENKIRWAAGGRLLAIGSDTSHLFLWNSRALTPAGNRVIPRPSGEPNDYVMETHLDLDSDIYLTARQNGFVQAQQPSNGKDLPINWRWTQDTLNDSGFGLDFAIQPCAAGSGVRAAILESDYRLRHLIEKSKPKPPSPPIPKPQPQPKLSDEQRAFLEKEKRMITEVEDVVNKLMSEEETLPESEKTRLEARANELNAQIRNEHNLFFPPAPQPKPEPPKPKWTQISLWDLSNNRLLWRKRVRQHSETPVLSWSPDGKLLAIFGVARPSQEYSGSEESSGIEICDGLTGKTVSEATQAYRNITADRGGVFWLNGPVLAVKDKNNTRQDYRNMLRFIDPFSGATTQLLKFPDTMKNADVLSTDAGGTTWVFASSQEGWRAFSKSELQIAN